VGERRVAIRRGQHLIAVARKRDGQRLAHSRVVIDHEDPHVIHFARSCDAGPAYL
jgi:hypothetical protein